MKKTITILALTLLFSYACNHELDSFKVNPNNSESATPDLLLTAAEVATFASQTAGLVRTTNVLDQHLTGTNVGQFGRVGRYDMTDESQENEYTNLYSVAMENAFLIMDRYGADNPYYDGMAQVLMAINLSMVTDLWNAVPYKDAFGGLKGNLHPKYQEQADIYDEIQKMLTEAIADFKKSTSDNARVPGADDLIFNGDVAKWKQIAYVLQARYALRLSQIDNKAAEKALGYINSSGISSSEDDDMKAVFDGGGSSMNQWYAIQTERGDYLKMGATFINMMKDSDDPRLAFFATTDASGGYSGSEAGDQENKSVSNIGPALAALDRNLGMVTYVEAKFIEAEAQFRTGGDAKAAFREAVRASVEQVTGKAADMDFVAQVTATVDLENIIKQKYIALFGSIEPYNDWRRTGFPALTPSSAAQTQKIPLRLITPKNERLYNPNAIVVTDLYQPVDWDR